MENTLYKINVKKTKIVTAFLVEGEINFLPEEFGCYPI